MCKFCFVNSTSLTWMWNPIEFPRNLTLILIMKTYGSFNELLVANTVPEHTGSDMTVDNMTQVDPKAIGSDSSTQIKLQRHWIGCKGNEYEAPHATIRSPDNIKARVRLRDGSLMEPSKVDRDVIKAVQDDILENPNKYIENWNENNPEHKIPVKEKQSDEQQKKKDESWKEAAWYKDSQQISAAYEEGTRQG